MTSFEQLYCKIKLRQVTQVDCDNVLFGFNGKSMISLNTLIFTTYCSICNMDFQNVWGYIVSDVSTFGLIMGVR